MSRFSQSPGTKFRVWSPPESPLRIEYVPGLFQEALHARFGTLYGEIFENIVRIVAAKGEGTPVGIFIVRERGELFMTEEDLQRFEESDAKVALVIASARAGFFVRQPDGSIQSIRSHQEIPTPQSLQRKWARLPAAAMALVAIALGTTWALRPAPLSLSIREDAGQLRISFTRSEGQLEITDGRATRVVQVDPSTTHLTYAPQSADVQIRLTSGGRIETARYVGIDPAAKLRAEIDALELEANTLAAQSTQNRERAAGLQKTLSTMKRAD